MYCSRWIFRGKSVALTYPFPHSWCRTHTSTFIASDLSDSKLRVDHAHSNYSSVSLRSELSPYDCVSSESEQEMTQNHVQNCDTPEQDNKLGRTHLSPSKGCLNKGRWDVPYSDRGSRPLDRHDIRHDISPDTRPTESQGFSPGNRLPEQQAYSPDIESLDQPRYSSISRTLDHRVCSPDRFIHGSSTQKFPASYGAQRTNGEERITIPEYRREVSPKRLKVQQVLCLFSEYE